MYLSRNPSISQYNSSAEYNEGFWAQKLKYQVFTPFQGNSLYCQYIIFSSHLLNDISLRLPGFLIDKTPPLQKVKLTWQTSCPQGSHKIPSFYQTGTYVLCNTAKYLTSENVNSQYCQISYIWECEFPILPDILHLRMWIPNTAKYLTSENVNFQYCQISYIWECEFPILPDILHLRMWIPNTAKYLTSENVNFQYCQISYIWECEFPILPNILHLRMWIPNTAKYLTSENVNSQYCQISYIWECEFPILPNILHLRMWIPNTAKYLTSENVNFQYCQISYIWQWEFPILPNILHLTMGFPKVFLKYKDYDYTYTINITYIHIHNYSSILKAMHCNGSGKAQQFLFFSSTRFACCLIVVLVGTSVVYENSPIQEIMPYINTSFQSLPSFHQNWWIQWRPYS